jgi:Ca2+-binding RTX toxin-like protein
LFGTFADDLMLGLSGSEALASQDGNDVLVGGPGNDVLDGGGGSDTYVFNPGDGLDEIRDDYSSSDTNRLRFGPGITVGDLALFDGGDGFTVNRIVIGTSGDEILLPNFIDTIPALTTAEFADSVTLNLINLNAANQRTDNQTITGGDGDTVLIGGTGNDTIIAGNGSTTLLGGAGSDTLIGGSGPNMFLGGPGNDFLIGGSGGNTFFLMVGSGLDAIQIPNYLTSIETNTVQFGGAYDTYHPTSGVGSLVIRYGTAGDELHILDFDPDDVFAPPAIHTFRFTDRTLTYGELIALGFDIEGTTGNDMLSGTNTTDRIDGLDGNDTIESGQGIDILRGGRGSDLLRGGAGDDTYLFNIGDEIDTIDDTVLPGKGNRIQFGAGITQGDLSFTRDDAPRTLTIQVGASGADKLVLANFDPTGVNGSLVVDTLIFAGGTTTNLADLFINHAPTVANPLADQSASTGTAFSFTVPADTFTDVDAGDVLTFSATLADGSALPAWLTFDSATRTFSGTPVDGDAGVVNLKVTATDTGTLSVADLFDATVTIQNQVLTGTAGNDVLTGGAGHDQLFGLAGNDTLNGAAGNDLLDGGTGTDTMAGGTENDTYVVDATGDIVTEQANEGTDTVQSALLTYTLGANVENLTLTVTGPSAGIGNGLANTLIGNSGANLLDGKAEADTMAGGAGDDLYIVDHVGDAVVELPGEGALDSVTSSVGYTLSANVENLVLTGSAAINGTGNDADNVLTGNSAANVLTGLGGNDTYVIGAGDTVVEAAGRGTDTVISTVSHSLAANVENLTLVGFSAISGTGNALDNVLNGLLNLGGNVLTGGAGNDTYIIGAGDTVVEASGGGTDTVQSLFTYTLGSNVENLTLTGIGAINGTGNGLNNTLTGNSANNTLAGAGGNDILRGGPGSDTMNGGSGNDTFLFGRGDGQDLVQDNSGTADKILYDAGINPLDLVISRQANDLRLTIYGSSDRITVQNWYVGTTNRTETIQAGNGQTLLSTQVDQLIQAMASFSQQTGLTWDQAIDQQPAQVQAVLAASWQ